MFGNAVCAPIWFAWYALFGSRLGLVMALVNVLAFAFWGRLARMEERRIPRATVRSPALTDVTAGR